MICLRGQREYLRPLSEINTDNVLVILKCAENVAGLMGHEDFIYYLLYLGHHIFCKLFSSCVLWLR